ncbi:uncharacterized protein TM35_000551270 [Trypanosoma theileri]|uniref:Mucin-associated surface protein (MASP) n=1 Tax=Trypanosoma theileri TaxID=67003 RepID=A0A1X0NH53_9TRYP|nr:uncharacterized protein TM35_000551270 [Trypanosoma theileri]ORC83858.1 hypothetical protein TM35_000551270 [Trypanosoma theileri]
MQVRRVLYFLALIMSVASVCLAADEAGGHEHSSASSNSGDGDCRPPDEENARNTLNGPLNIPQYCANQRPSNASPAGSSNGSAHPAAPSPPVPSPPIAEPPSSIAAGAAVEGNDGSSPSGGQTGANVNNPAGEGAVNAESTAAAQPTSPSPESSDTETANGSGTANDGGGSTPAGSESSNNPSDADNTENTTTTTTTTIPTVPEISNSNIMPNVKGDADSSSSISSSVWVRVPLLIVVTLACILVC